MLTCIVSRCCLLPLHGSTYTCFKDSFLCCIYIITLFIITYVLCILYFLMFEGPKEAGQMLIGFTLFK